MCLILLLIIIFSTGHSALFQLKHDLLVLNTYVENKHITVFVDTETIELYLKSKEGRLKSPAGTGAAGATADPTGALFESNITRDLPPEIKDHIEMQPLRAALSVIASRVFVPEEKIGILHGCVASLREKINTDDKKLIISVAVRGETGLAGETIEAMISHELAQGSFPNLRASKKVDSKLSLEQNLRRTMIEDIKKIVRSRLAPHQDAKLDLIKKMTSTFKRARISSLRKGNMMQIVEKYRNAA